MQKLTFGLVVLFSLFTLRANAYDFRHKNVHKARDGYYYITIAVGIPLTNCVGNFNNLGLGVDPSTDLGKLLSDNGILSSYSSTQTFPAKKIGGLMGLGYKMPYFFRFEIKADFLTFTRNYQLGTEASFGGNDITDIDFTVRQLGFIGSAYLDFDNPTSFTPYLGVGAGGALNKGNIYLNSTNENQSIDNGSFLDKVYFAYEFKAGFKLGQKKIYFDIEAFTRQLPALELSTQGVLFKAGFML